MSDFDLKRLYERIALRANLATARDSYTAGLLERGIDRIAQKLGEEATETIIAAIRLKQNVQSGVQAGVQQENSSEVQKLQKKHQIALCQESADLLYHLCLLWYACDTKPQDVYAILAERAAERDKADTEK